MSKNIRLLLSLHNRGISPDVIVLTAIDLSFKKDDPNWRFECSELINEFFTTAIVLPLLEDIKKRSHIIDTLRGDL